MSGVPICERLVHPYLDSKHEHLRQEAADTIAELHDALNVARDRIALWLEMERASGRPEGFGNAAIFARDLQVIDTALAKARGEA